MSFRPQIWHPEKSNVYCDDIGEETNVAALVEIQHGARIGRRCRIGALCFIPAGVDIGDDVFVGPGTVFTNDLFPSARSAANGTWEMRPTRIENEVSIGANATILCGITIGRGAVVGAGSVVTRDVPADAVVYGNPARVRRSVDRTPPR